MSNKTEDFELDDDDYRILKLLQQDATMSLQRIAERVDLSKTTVWNRVQRMVQNGVILRQAAILDPQKVGLIETFFVSVRTAHHDFEWLEQFKKVINEMPQITEAHRLAGTLDYLLKVQVPSTAAFDEFYKELVSRISIHDVSSSLSMETIKRSLEISVPGKM
ncbi:MAG: Lrp/AsnC family transcriptional regulator [Pseudomonadota bacterium]